MDKSLEAKILWRCRRGMLELDLILQQFASTSLYELSEEQLERLLSMLEKPDPELYAWFMGEAEPCREYKAIVELIRNPADSAKI